MISGYLMPVKSAVYVTSISHNSIITCAILILVPPKQLWATEAWTSHKSTLKVCCAIWHWDAVAMRWGFLCPAHATDCAIWLRLQSYSRVRNTGILWEYLVCTMTSTWMTLIKPHKYTVPLSLITNIFIYPTPIFILMHTAQTLNNRTTL